MRSARWTFCEYRLLRMMAGAPRHVQRVRTDSILQGGQLWVQGRLRVRSCRVEMVDGFSARFCALTDINRWQLTCWETLMVMDSCTSRTKRRPVHAQGTSLGWNFMPEQERDQALSSQRELRAIDAEPAMHASQVAFAQAARDAILRLSNVEISGKKIQVPHLTSGSVRGSCFTVAFFWRSCLKMTIAHSLKVCMCESRKEAALNGRHLQCCNKDARQITLPVEGTEDFTNLYVKCFPSFWNEVSPPQLPAISPCVSRALPGSVTM